MLVPNVYRSPAPANLHQKQKIRPAVKLTEASRFLHTVSLTSQVQAPVPVANMASPGEPSGGVPSHTDQDVEKILPGVEATPADKQSGRIWASSIEQGVKQTLMLYQITRDDRSSNKRKYTKERIQSYIDNVRVYLLHLLHVVEPRPELKKNGVDKALAYFLPPKFPQKLATMAADLSVLAQKVLEKYESEQWGEDFTNDQGEESEADGDSGSRPSAQTYTEEISLPPPSHPIWGRNGIMHGLACKTNKTGRLVRVHNPTYYNEKRNPKVLGHNDHTPGAWWPYLGAAHFHGAHGSSQAGITGDPDRGAYSIVVSPSSVYRELNEDRGTDLWYSADKSTKNTSAAKTETSNPTRSLETSWKNGKPVRVLRKAPNKPDPRSRAIYPTVGFRYDGLYKVVDRKIGHNKLGGAFKLFKLERLPDSDNAGVSWEDVQKYPTKEQRRQFMQIKDGY